MVFETAGSLAVSPAWCQVCAGEWSTVEKVLLAVGQQVGCENSYSDSRINKAVVVFLKKERFVSALIESVIWLKSVMIKVSSLSAL